MQLFLLRHAEAQPSAADDFDRALTPKGMQQAQRVSEFLLRHDLRPQLLLTSPVRRARETAQILRTHLDIEMLEQPWLACGMVPEVALAELQAFDHFASLLIAGHEPDLSRLAGYLTGMREPQIRIRKASLTLIEFSGAPCTRGELQFSIPAKYLP